VLFQSMASRRVEIENYKLIKTVNQLQIEVDGLTKELYTLKQQQKDMLEQIRRLKEKELDDNK
jgi:uncharacterized protein YoxC